MSANSYLYFIFYFKVGIIARLDRLEENQDVTIRMLRSALSKAGYDEESDDGEDIFPTVMKTVQDMEVLETRLQDKIYRRKLVTVQIF